MFPEAYVHWVWVGTTRVIENQALELSLLLPEVHSRQLA